MALKYKLSVLFDCLFSVLLLTSVSYQIKNKNCWHMD